ncbi:hypothetical protein OK074_8064 [Actinobacteria bacterium OK074]|nr:hypothetical protein OK074_8064 [Actinobacteria bacterium OK074]
MRRTRLGMSTALVAACAATGLAFAQTASAVTPQTATITADCGFLGGGEATLTATQDGTAATLTLSSTAITSPIALDADTITADLTLVNNTNGGTVSFAGTENPAIAAGGGVTVGPLNGTVASGDSLEAYGGTLQLTVLGIAITCTATAPQSPGPFVFD